jgi:hypothetical protein
MGLLDGALDNDLTRFGLGLLAASGPTNDPMKGAFGNRLMQAVGSFDDYRKEKAQAERAKQMQEFQAFQMEQAKAQALQQQAAQADALKKRSIFSQNFQSAVGPSADGFGPTRPMQFDHKQAAAQLGQAGFGEDALDLMSKFAPKPADYRTVGNTLLQIGADGPKPVFTEAPKPAAPSPLSQLLEERNKYPEGSATRRLYDQLINKTTTHQAPVNVSYGAPVAGVDAQGNSVFFQPSKNGGAAAIIPGVAPANSGPKLTEDQAKATQWLAQAENAFANMMAAKAKDKNAVMPGTPEYVEKVPLIGVPVANSMRTSERQRYIQGASSFGEAALRAATGAGMNEYEARQKIAQFTPTFMDKDETILQKERDMKVFLETLRPRATGKPNAGGKGAAPTDDNDPLGIRR